jgi:broad specificity phosphatase PhoE
MHKMHLRIHATQLSMWACLFCLQMPAAAQVEEGVFTLYFVRHSEKTSESMDPELTVCGVERSESLNAFFDAVPLAAVYSTDYRRTWGTAQPTARSKGLEIQEYDPRTLEEVMAALIERRQDALVVGHSNTTGVLAGLFVGENIGAFDESIYNRVYQVVVTKSERRLHVLHTAFRCGDH